MQVFKDINNLPAFHNSVISIGTFDGVHSGHAEIIHSITAAAKRVNGESIIITFHPHPRHIISPVYFLISLFPPLFNFAKSKSGRKFS